MKLSEKLDWFKNLFNNDSLTIKKGIIVLSVFGVFEYFIWQQLNYYHGPNRIAAGIFLSFLITIISFVY